MNWRFIPGKVCDFQSWSFGRVTAIADLYDPQIFGPRRELVCECGKYEGQRHEGMICELCGVKVSSQAAVLRQTRLGHVHLAVPCKHPLGENWVDDFPVAPYAIRVTPDGKPNALGRKYEGLLTANAAIASALPPSDSDDFLHAQFEQDRTALQTALASLVGRETAGDDPACSAEPADTLFRCVCQHLGAMGPSLPALFRAMGLAIHIEGTT